MGEMLEVCRSSVQTWECDLMGHMNVQFYVAHATSGLATLGKELGLGPSYLRSQHFKLLATDHHIRYLREMRPGMPFYVRGGVIEMYADQFRFFLEFRQSSTNQVMATLSGTAVLSDITGQERNRLPDTARSRADVFQIDLPDYGAPKGLALEKPGPAPTLDDADRLGLTPVFQGMVKDADCDADGYMMNRHFIGHISEGIPNLMVSVLNVDRSENDGLGGAALEYYMVYRKRPRAGDILCVRSGLRAIAEKTYIWGHWMFDIETGEAVSTSAAVAISMDLNARRAIPIPDDLRRALTDRLVTDFPM